MKLIELHLLQSFPATCLNRDDVGAPKSILFGGVNRARVSSQCWKRAIRQIAATNAPKAFAGIRGHYHAESLEKELIVLGVDAETAKNTAREMMTAYGEKGKKEGQTSVALYFSPTEIKAIATELKISLDKASETQKGKKESGIVNKSALSKAIKNTPPHDLADIAVMGRMVAADHSLMLEGAGMFSHAISTHAVANEVDFFSAVDDTKPFDTTGAGHLGTLEMNSACYYRYIGLNVDLLFDEAHLGKLGPNERKAVLDVFLQAVIEAVPGARKNSIFGFTRPQYVLGLVRSGQPLSLVNAFETPVKAEKQSGYVAPSISAIEKHWNSLKTEYELGDKVFCEVQLNESRPLSVWINELVAAATEV